MDDAPGTTEGTQRTHRTRRFGAKALLVVGCVLLLLANLTVWLRLTALDTDRFVSALAPLSDDPQLDDGLAVALTDRIMTRVDVQARVEAALPNDNPLVVATVTRLARSLVQDTLRNVLASDAFSTIWVGALERTHRRALEVIDGADGSVALQLTDVLTRADAALEERGLDLIDSSTIDEVSQVVIARSDQVQTAGRAVDILRTLAVVLPVATLVVLALAVLVARDRRRALALVGVGIAVAMVVTAVALRIGRRMLFDRIDGEVRRQAAGDVWTGLLSSLFRQTAVLLALGLLLAIGAWLAGPAEGAVKVRGWFGARGAETVQAPSPVVAALGRRLRQVQAGVCVVGAAVLLLLPSLSVATVVVVLSLVVVVLVVLELVAGGPGRHHPSGAATHA